MGTHNLTQAGSEERDSLGQDLQPLRERPRIRSSGKLRKESILGRKERVTGIKCCQRLNKVRRSKSPLRFAIRRPLVSLVGTCLVE